MTDPIAHIIRGIECIAPRTRIEWQMQLDGTWRCFVTRLQGTRRSIVEHAEGRTGYSAARRVLKQMWGL